MLVLKENSCEKLEIVLKSDSGEREANKNLGSELLAISSSYAKPQFGKSLAQVCITLGLWLVSYVGGLSMVESSLYGAGLAVVAAAALVVRLFIIQHDCGHRSFFRSRRACDLLGFWLGILTMTPYRCWLRFHAAHHSNAGNLNRRGLGDIHTLTVKEYVNLTPAKQRWYRVYRHPLVLLVIGPPLLFILHQRTTYQLPKAWVVERRSVHLTNFFWLASVALPCVFYGPLIALSFHLTMMSLAAMGGVWLFYMQHQFPETYWRQDREWISWRASMEGASYLDLPAWLRWLTASIGLHHIHHLDPRIPNYRLYECFTKHAEFASPTRITLQQSVACLRLRLWDVQSGRMVPLPCRPIAHLGATS